MILTLSTAQQSTTDLGCLLQKNPARHDISDLSFGTAHVVYPEATEDGAPCRFWSTSTRLASCESIADQEATTSRCPNTSTIGHLRPRHLDVLDTDHVQNFQLDIVLHSGSAATFAKGGTVSTARNGEVDIHYEVFGDPSNPTLLLINGLGSQCINYAESWCQLFCDEGFQVVRFDNRDVGLSTKLDGIDYSLVDMGDDAIAVLDAVGGEKAHVMGCSMGGMIVQRLAIDHGDRMLSMTSVMSRTGEPGYGDSSEAALAFLMAPPAGSRSAYIEHQVAALHVYGSKPEWLDDNAIRDRAAAAYDRCFCPAGISRQMTAVMHDGSRDEQLAKVDLPALVIHGSRDALIDPSGGQHTAAIIPGARYFEIDGMGHDYPPHVWHEWVSVWSEFVHNSVPT